ncbi:hypothetical protein SELMODRAFT_415067 [Selaginella moellendorffii]|uniref:Uncharacterized protein n=1 Tax=Selaginella moellendorffii TaxID=88036 RepID=D8RUI8_SELML|nr:hypothetical protein SELMODRAFT_415067 [Selaginella moellendorffii]
MWRKRRSSKWKTSVQECTEEAHEKERKKERKEKKSQEPRKLQFIGARKPAAPVPMKSKTQQGCRGWPEPDHVLRRYPAIKTEWKFSRLVRRIWSISRQIRQQYRRDSKVSDNQRSFHAEHYSSGIECELSKTTA